MATPEAAGRQPKWSQARCATLVMEGLQEHVAQSVEQRTFNAWVLGSIPSVLTTPQAATPFKIQPRKT